MSKYTTGEIAKLCGVTVRTVQYYDNRGILIPTELSEGGRRLYSEKDLSKMKVICFLRELDIPLSNIAELMKEENSKEVIEFVLSEQVKVLKKELKRQEKEKARAAKKAEKKAKKKKIKAQKKLEKKRKRKLEKEREAETGIKKVKPNVKENLEMILTLLKKLYAVTKGKFKIRLRRMYIAVGTGDAAKTAIQYGIIVQSASYLLNFLNEFLFPIKKHEGEVNVYPDYTASKTTVDVDITCSFKIRSLIAIGASMALTFLSARTKALKKAALREKRKAEKEAKKKKEN